MASQEYLDKIKTEADKELSELQTIMNDDQQIAQMEMRLNLAFSRSSFEIMVKSDL